MSRNQDALEQPCPAGNITARVPVKVHQKVGENVWLRWQAADAHLFDLKTERRVG